VVHGNGAAGSSTGPLRYSDRDRKRDYRQGRKDARKHLPAVSRRPAPEAPVAEPTPFLTGLFHQRNQVLAEMYVRCLDEQNRLQDQLRDADGRRRHQLSEQGVTQARLDEVGTPLTEEEATRRHFGEEAAGHPEGLVRRRRAKDRQGNIDAAQDQLRDITRRLHEAEVAVGRAQDDLEGLLRATQARGIVIYSYFEQRKANYLDGLVHRHHRGPEILRALSLTDPGLPEWLPMNTKALEGT
jgi:hypothetical protein